METEQCPLCGVSVKRENLKGHYARVHPKQPRSLVRPTQTFARASVFKSHRRRNLAILALFTLAVIGISYAASEFAAANTMAMHWHPQLSVTINGSPVTVPARIGIDPSLWKDHSLDQYGMEGMSPCTLTIPPAKFTKNRIPSMTLPFNSFSPSGASA